MQEERQTGTVKWFDERKGYGFIQQENGEDLFVHFSQIEDMEGYRKLDENSCVSFEVGEGVKKGNKMATNVRLEGVSENGSKAHN